MKKAKLVYSFFTTHYSPVIPHFLRKILLLVICALTVSCASSPAKRHYDIFDEVNLNKNQFINEIKLRENKIEVLKGKVQKLNNYNDKFKFLIDFESSYNKDISSLGKAYSTNKEIINRYEIQINKLNLEIRVLKRKI